MVAAISFALALFLSIAFVPVAIRYAHALGLVDQPDEVRKVHSQPIPRIGGVAITLAFFVPALLWLTDVSSLSGLLLGAAVIAFFGFLDDRHDLNYKWKFFGQILGVGIFLSVNVEITKTPFLGLGDVVPWISYPVLALFLLGVTNAVNLSDGLDGLAAGSSLLSLGFIAFLAYTSAQYPLVILAVSVMGALTGFLKFNTHPASVFMGDTGSQFLGFMTGCLAVMVTQSPQMAVSPVLVIIIIGLPILDTLMVILLRLRDRLSPFKPDKRHLHHQFLSIGLQHYQAVAALYLLNFVLLIIAYLMRYQSDWSVLISYLLFCTTTLGLIAFFKHSSYSQSRRKELAEKAERRNPFFRQMHWLHKHGAEFIQYILGLLWIGFMFVGDCPTGMMVWYVCAALALALVHGLAFKSQQPLLARLIFYSASVIATYMLVYQLDFDVPTWRALSIFDLPILVLVAVLALVIRTTRRDQFQMDNQDILVLLILLAAPLLSINADDSNTLIGAIVRLAVLLYASEYIITRLPRPSAATAMSAIAFTLYLMKGLVF